MLIKIRFRDRSNIEKPEDIVGRYFRYRNDRNLAWRYTEYYRREDRLQYQYTVVRGTVLTGDEKGSVNGEAEVKHIKEGNYVEVYENSLQTKRN